MDIVTSSAFSGMWIVIMIVLVIVTMILGLALYRKNHPDSALAKDIRNAESSWREAVAAAAEPFGDLGREVEIGVGNELNSLLTKVEMQLTDTSAQDKAIAAAREHLATVTKDVENRIATANAQKAAKVAALQLHVSVLNTAISNVSGS